MNKYKGLWSLLLAGFIFGTFMIWIRLLNKQINVFEQIVLRNAFTLLFSIGAILLVKSTRQAGKVSKLSLLGFGLAVPLSVIFYNLSALSTTVVIAIFSFYAGTIVTGGLIGIFVHKEILTRKAMLSYVLAFLGIAVMAFPFSEIGMGLIFGLCAGVFDGISNGLRKSLSGKIPKFQLVLITGIAGVLISGLVLLLNKQDPLNLFNQPSWVYLVGALFGLLLVIVNYLTLVGFQNYDVGLGTIIISVELIFATLFGLLIFKEIPSIKDVVSGLFIIAAILIQNLDLKKLKKPNHLVPSGG